MVLVPRYTSRASYRAGNASFAVILHRLAVPTESSSIVTRTQLRTLHTSAQQTVVRRNTTTSGQTTHRTSTPTTMLVTRRMFSSSSGGRRTPDPEPVLSTRCTRLDTVRLPNAHWLRMAELERTFELGPVLDGPSVPILTPPGIERMIDLVETLNILPEASYSAFASASRLGRSGHLYVHVACPTTVEAMAALARRTEEEIRRILGQPYTFPLLWGGCMPYGGVSLDVCPNPQIGSRLLGPSRLILTDGRDPILLSNHTAVRSPSSQASATFFLARTLYGHALTGSVLHYMLVTPDGRVVFVWLGAGAGVPVIGGHLNNIVALHDGHGIWPAMVRNLRVAMTDPTVFELFARAVEGPPADARDVITAANDIFRLRTQHRSSQYALGQLLNVHGGRVVRTLSSLWGGSGMNPKGEGPSIV